ncbi:MAG: hypothetical protein RSC82_02380 [Oscillospiraceae bacterium]
MKTTKFAAGLLVAVVLTGAVTAYAVQGGQDDPLVTLSYLTKVVTPKLEAEVSKAVAANEKALTDKLNAAITAAEQKILSQTGTASPTFSSVTLQSGESKIGGSEYLVRTGKALCVGNLLDSTAGTTVKNGSALTRNHLYVALDEFSGVKAAEYVTLMVR